MLIAEILNKKGSGVRTLTDDVSIQRAIEELAEKHVGALVISHDEHAVDGILSERDVVRALAAGEVDFSKTKVSELMTREVVTCTPDTKVTDVMGLMNERNIRHVPVAVDGKLVGIVSIRDIVDARVREVENESQQMADYIAGNA